MTAIEMVATLFLEWDSTVEPWMGFWTLPAQLLARSEAARLEDPGCWTLADLHA